MKYQLFRFFAKFVTQNFALLIKAICPNQMSEFCCQQHLRNQTTNVLDFCKEVVTKHN